jgi:hypothetical protein
MSSLSINLGGVVETMKSQKFLSDAVANGWDYKQAVQEAAKRGIMRAPGVHDYILSKQLDYEKQQRGEMTGAVQQAINTTPTSIKASDTYQYDPERGNVEPEAFELERGGMPTQSEAMGAPGLQQYTPEQIQTVPAFKGLESSNDQMTEYQKSLDEYRKKSLEFKAQDLGMKRDSLNNAKANDSYKWARLEFDKMKQGDYLANKARSGAIDETSELRPWLVAIQQLEKEKSKLAEQLNLGTITQEEYNDQESEVNVTIQQMKTEFIPSVKKAVAAAVAEAAKRAGQYPGPGGVSKPVGNSDLFLEGFLRK